MTFASNMMTFIINDADQAMATDPEATERAKNILKAELKRRGVSYRRLVELLAERGVHETERNLSNKISRGGFTAAFMIQCLDAIGCSRLDISAN